MILGVDPGLHGAFALLDDTGENIIDVIDTPTFRIKGKSILNISELARWLDDANARQAITKAFVEEVGAMPGNGGVSMFNFGKVYGSALGIVAAHFIPVIDVRPQRWKRDYKLSDDKDASRRAAIAMWPTKSALFSRVKDDGRAEACLLAAWGAKRDVMPDFMG